MDKEETLFDTIRDAHKDTLHPWQVYGQQVLGFARGELNVMAVGRSNGKSQLTSEILKIAKSRDANTGSITWDIE